VAVFDTTFLIDVLRNQSRAIALVDRLEETGEPQTTPAPVAFEVATELGRRATPAARARALERPLAAIPVAPFDREMALEAGRISGRLLDAGTPIDDVDCMVAATAIVLGDRVVTRNRRHFERVPGLRVVAY
jgi:tRNA(fMet)-specific endonuclease VapC